jgi:hypothetical protein
MGKIRAKLKKQRKWRNFLLQQKGLKKGIVYWRIEEIKKKSGGALKALEVILLPSDNDIDRD